MKPTLDMIKKSILAAITVFSACSWAQAIEDCYYIKNKTRRLECFDQRAASPQVQKLTPKITTDFIKQREFDYTRCRVQLTHSRAESMVTGKYVSAIGCGHTAILDAEKEYANALANIGDNTAAISAFKQYYAAWNGVMSAFTINDQAAARLNELCQRTALELPPAENRNLFCSH